MARHRNRHGHLPVRHGFERAAEDEFQRWVAEAVRARRPIPGESHVR